jgi:hypothetical protein
MIGLIWEWSGHSSLMLGVDVCVWCDKKKCSDISGEMTGHEWCIYSEIDKSSGEYLSTFQGMTEGRKEKLNCET